MINKSTLWKFFKEWGILLLVVLALRYTGLMIPTLAFVQGLVLKTGLFSPSLKTEDKPARIGYDFTLEDKDGQVSSFAAFKGKTLLVNFWAPWCGPCVAEMPTIQALYDRIGSDKSEIQLVLLCPKEDFADAKKYMSKKGYSLPIFIAPHGVDSNFNHESIPSSYAIDKKGDIQLKISGMKNYDDADFYAYLKLL